MMNTPNEHTRSWHPDYFDTRFRTTTPRTWFNRNFVIVTACATTGEQWDRDRELQADTALQLALATMLTEHVRVTGYSPASGHAEQGWAAALPVPDGITLGAQFLQDAVFVVHDGNLWLHCCRGERAPANVGPIDERLDIVPASE